MLYLEDYLELIEGLPQELRDRFTEMREMDLSVQNSMDSLEKKVKIFFSNAKKMKPNEKEAEYETIRKEYYKTLEDADEKVHLANQMHETVDRYLQRLDQEIHKFKMELEADNEGITEILEKRSLGLDQPQQNCSQKENRYTFARSASLHEKRRDSNSSASAEKRVMTEKVQETKAPAVVPAAAAAVSTSAQPPSTPSGSSAVPTGSGNVGYSLGHIGAGGNAIAAAVTQAIAATQHMQQGRRTASLKASYEAINTGVPGDFSIGKELVGAAQAAVASIQETTKKQKKKTTTTASSSGILSSMAGQSQGASVPATPSPPVAMEEMDSNSGLEAAIDNNAENPEWMYDPNETRYCICNQVSYGTMVACDNQDCPMEWFHYACVNIRAPPKGKWYCPQCSAAMKRRNRKN